MPRTWYTLSSAKHLVMLHVALPVVMIWRTWSNTRFSAQSKIMIVMTSHYALHSKFFFSMLLVARCLRVKLAPSSLSSTRVEFTKNQKFPNLTQRARAQKVKLAVLNFQVSYKVIKEKLYWVFKLLLLTINRCASTTVIDRRCERRVEGCDAWHTFSTIGACSQLRGRQLLLDSL